MLRPFRLVQPGTLSEAGSELERLGDGASVYAGGAELLLLMQHGVVRPDYLIDIKRIPELNALEARNRDVLIGAAVTHHRLERDALVRSRLPMLAAAESHVGNVRVRNQGTLGGNICFADPHADPPTVLLIHEATVDLYSPRGGRSLPIEEFLLGTYETALEPGEIVVGFHVPALPAGWGWSYQRNERFYRPTLSVAAAAWEKDGRIEYGRLAVGCVGPQATRLRDLEDQIRGLTNSEARRVISESAPALHDLLEPVDDLLGSADYKIEITTVLLRRALEAAVKGGELGGSTDRA